MKKDILRLMLPAVLLLSGLMPSHAQQLRVYPLPTQPLLPVAQVHDIVQAADGCMWYATSDGLCRDNGYQVDVFRPGKNDSGVMHSANIRDLACTNGHVVFATDEGLYSIGLVTLRVSRVALPAEVNSKIGALFVAHDGSVWVAADRHTVHLNKDLGLIKVYSCRGWGIGFYEDSSRRLWRLSDGGLSVLLPGGKAFTHRLDYDVSLVAMCEAEARNLFWIATYRDGIVLYNATNGSITRQEASLAGDADGRIISMRRDHTSGLLWVTTMSGLDTYATAAGRLVRVSAVAGIPDRRLIVDRLCEDRYGNMWVAGFSPTTFIAAPDVGRTLRMEADGMRRATGFCLLADRMVADTDGYYWIWQGRYGLSLYHEGQAPSFLFTAKPQGLTSVERGIQKCTTLPGIVAYRGNTVWHLWHEGMTIECRRVVSIPGGDVCGVRADARGRLWTASHKALSLFLPVSGQTRTLYKGDVTLLGAVADGGAACLFASGQTVYKVSDNGRVVRMATVGEDITFITTDADGTAWVSTREGHVFGCKDGKAEAYSALSDPNGNTIKQIEVDNTGCLWTLTDQTVTRYNPQTNACVRTTAADPDIRVDYFYRLEPEARGMGVAGAGAYCVLPAQAMSSEAVSRAVPFVTAVATADTTVLIGMGRREADVAARAPSVSVSMATGEHLFADKVSFAWRIGKSGAWTVLPQGSNQAVLGRLPKGDYDLYVKATDRFGNWGDPQLCITLHRLPAWWESWWAWLLYVVAAVAAVGGLVWLATRIWYLKRLQKLRSELNLRQVSINPEDVSAKRYDAEFNQKMVAAIEEHLGDPAYNVQWLAADMHTSRANLFRKCRALTGKNPTSLIREIRLKAAASMLSGDPGASVADIAAKVGFATPSYFTKCFKEMFGKLPNEYKNPAPSPPLHGGETHPH